MADNQVKIRVGADLADADAAIDAFATHMPRKLHGVSDEARETASAFSGLSRDTLNANQAAEVFGRQASKSLQDVDKNLLQNRESARLLSEELGLHLPRAVTSAISEMLPFIGGLGGAFLAAFAIEEIPKLVQGIRDATDEMAGFGEKAKKAFEDAVKVSDDAITHFKTIKEGVELEKEVNRNIAALSVQKDVLDSTGGVAVNYAKAVMGFMSGNVAAAAAHVAMARMEKLDMAELANLEQQRLEQLNTRSELEGKAREEEAEAAKRASREAAADANSSAEEQKRSLEELNRLSQEVIREKFRWEREWDRLVKEDVRSEQEAFKAIRLGPDLGKDFFTPLVSGFHQLTEAERAALPVGDQINNAMLREAQTVHDLTIEMNDRALPAFRRIEMEYDRRIEAANREIAKLREEYLEHKITRAEMEDSERAYTQTVEESAKIRARAKREEAEATAQTMASEIATFVGSIAGRKAQAEVEGGFYLAEGAYDLARGIWPPNPALIARGLGEIGSGIEMLKVAGASGRSSGSYGGGGGGGSGYGSRASEYGRYGSGRDDNQPYGPQTLAPGAAGSGGRFGSPGSGVVIIRGTQEFENYVASAVNGAVSRGVTVTATASQRGAPVGH